MEDAPAETPDVPKVQFIHVLAVDLVDHPELEAVANRIRAATVDGQPLFRNKGRSGTTSGFAGQDPKPPVQSEQEGWLIEPRHVEAVLPGLVGADAQGRPDKIAVSQVAIHLVRHSRFPAALCLAVAELPSKGEHWDLPSELEEVAKALRTFLIGLGTYGDGPARRGPGILARIHHTCTYRGLRAFSDAVEGYARQVETGRPLLESPPPALKPFLPTGYDDEEDDQRTAFVFRSEFASIVGSTVGFGLYSLHGPTFLTYGGRLGSSLDLSARAIPVGRPAAATDYVTGELNHWILPAAATIWADERRLEVEGIKDRLTSLKETEQDAGVDPEARNRNLREMEKDLVDALLDLAWVEEICLVPSEQLRIPEGTPAIRAYSIPWSPTIATRRLVPTGTRLDVAFSTYVHASLNRLRAALSTSLEHVRSLGRLAEAEATERLSRTIKRWTIVTGVFTIVMFVVGVVALLRP